MRFEQFSDYLHERSVLLQSGDLSAEKRQSLSQAIMQEEDYSFDWKVGQEMLESWIGIRKEVTV